MKKIKYTIYTENTPQLRPLLDHYLSGYTVHIGEGRWDGFSEQSATIIYISFVGADPSIQLLIQRILVDCKQDSVYLETQEIELEEHTKRKGGDNMSGLEEIKTWQDEQARKHLAKLGKTLKDYPWPGDPKEEEPEVKRD